MNTLKIYRTECFQKPLFINIGTDDKPIRLDFNNNQDLGAEIYIGIYWINSSFNQSILLKKFTHLDANEYGDIVIKLSPMELRTLIPGSYKYAIKLRLTDEVQGDWVSTVVEDADLIII